MFDGVKWGAESICTRARDGASFGALIFALGFGCAGNDPITTCVAAGGVTPICSFQNPEDLAVSRMSPGWLVVSQAPRGDAPGTLIAFRPTDGEKVTLWGGDSRSDTNRGMSSSCPGPPDVAEFRPHGIDFAHDGRTLFVVNHGGREAVEIFAVANGHNAEPRLGWSDCVEMPEDAVMNDVAALPHGGFVVTRMSSTGLGSLALLFGRESGEVHHWDPVAGLREIPNSAGKGPNGVAASPDGRTVFYSEWIAHGIVELELDGASRKFHPVGFNPDNLSWDGRGRLLIGGQIATPLEAASCFDLEAGACSVPSAVARFDPATGTVERLWTDDPASVTGGVSVALEHDGKIWIGSYAGDRLVWMPAP